MGQAVESDVVRCRRVFAMSMTTLKSATNLNPGARFWRRKGNAIRSTSIKAQWRNARRWISAAEKVVRTLIHRELQVLCHIWLRNRSRSQSDAHRVAARRSRVGGRSRCFLVVHSWKLRARVVFALVFARRVCSCGAADMFRATLAHVLVPKSPVHIGCVVRHCSLPRTFSESCEVLVGKLYMGIGSICSTSWSPS